MLRRVIESTCVVSWSYSRVAVRVFVSLPVLHHSSTHILTHYAHTHARTHRQPASLPPTAPRIYLHSRPPTLPSHTSRLHLSPSLVSPLSILVRQKQRHRAA